MRRPSPLGLVPHPRGRAPRLTVPQGRSRCAGDAPRRAALRARPPGRQSCRPCQSPPAASRRAPATRSAGRQGLTRRAGRAAAVPGAAAAAALCAAAVGCLLRPVRPQPLTARPKAASASREQVGAPPRRRPWRRPQSVRALAPLHWPPPGVWLQPLPLPPRCAARAPQSRHSPPPQHPPPLCQAPRPAAQLRLQRGPAPPWRRCEVAALRARPAE